MNSRYPSRLTTILASFILGFLLVSFLASSAQAQVEQIRENLRVIHAVKHDLSQPLRDVDVSELPPMRREGETNEIYNETPQGGYSQKPEGFIDPALQAGQGNLSQPTILKNFDGLGVADDDEILGGRFAPPDPVIEVGDDYIVESINIVTAVYDKNGNFVMDPIPNNALWADFGGVCENQNSGDPIVNYDQAEDRWMISQFANVGGPDGMQCVAVSQTSDPSGAYYRYAFPTNGTDYPKMGVGTEAYYLSWRDFDAGGGSMSAAALEKDSMLVGNDADMVAFGPTSGVFTRPPADIDGQLPPADTPHPFPALGSDAVEIWGLNPDFQDPGNSTFEVLADLSVDAFDSEVCSAFRGQCVPQPNGPDLETLSGVIMHRPNVRDMGDHMSMVATHTVDVGNERAGMRWYEFRNDGSGWTVHQQGTYAPDDGLHRWMASIALNPDGGIALGYSVSSTSQNPAIRFTGRPQGAPLGQMTFPETEIFEGPVSQGGTSRWGDYTAMVTDAANPNTFWYVGEYASDDYSTFNWDTRIAAFQFETDDATPPEAIADLSATPAGPVGIDLSWTAPSDPPDGDAAASYDIRYSTDPIETESDFADAQEVDGEPAPSDPGTTESMSVSGLTPDTEYFFAIKSSDLVGNVSDLNTNLPVSATTDPAPIVGTDPDSLSQTLAVGESGSDILAILNEGAGTLDFSLTPEVGGTAVADPLGDLGRPTASTDYPEGQYETSAGAPPESGEPTVETSQEMVYQPELGETVYYGVNSGDATEFVSFQGNNPEELNAIGGSYPGGFPNAGDFPSDDDSFVYDLSADNVLRKINVETGEITELGNVSPDESDWCGMTTDPSGGQIYVNSCEALYTLDPAGPSVERIGGFGIEFMIDIAIDGEGQMYGYGLNADVLYEIDKETGEITEVGSIGFDANFGQGLTWDTKNQVLLMTAFNNAAFQPEFRSVDRQTGSTELIGVLGSETPGGTNQLGWFGTSIDAIPQWLTVDPNEGEVEAGGSQDVTASYQTSGFEEGDDLLGGLNYFADVVVESNDPSTPTMNVPVTLTVEGNPAIGFSDDPLDFGEVFSGTSQTDTLSIMNESDDAILQVANLQITDSEVFTLLDNSDFVLNPGESMGVPVRFAPDASDTFEGTLSLASSAGDQEVGLTGQGVPFVSIAPDSLSQTIDLTTGDSTATDEFTVTNEFDESLPFEVVIEALAGGSNSVDLTPKLTDEQLRRYRQIQNRAPRSSDVEPSLEPAPGTGERTSAIERVLSESQLDETGVTGYANDYTGGSVVSFDIGVPGEFTVLDEFVDSFAGNFAFANNEEIFWIDNETNELKTYVLEDGTIETVGELEPVGSDVTWTDIETDPTDGTTYVTSGEGDTNRLYELDVDDAELTPIGTFAGSNLVVALGIDDQGVGYAHDISDDQILTVDLETADWEVLGSTGIDANYAQSMTWDGETGQMLMAALHDCSLFGCNSGTLRQVNRETGNTTAIGSFPDGGGNELTWFATPGTGIPWLATNLSQGTLPAGATLTLEAQYDASQQVEGEYSAQISIVGSELEGEPSEALPVSLTVEAEPILFLSKSELGFEKTFVNDTTGAQLVTLRNDGLANMNINSVSIDSENFAVTPDSSVTIEPGDAQIFEVRFTPQEVGDLSATLSFEGDEVSGEVALSGEGIPAPELALDPTSFEKQAYVGQQAEYSLDVSNVGEDTLEYSAVSTTGDLVNEEFAGDEFPPEGWSRSGANDGMNWTTPEASACSIWVPEDDAACFYWSPSTEGTQRLITKQFDTGGLNELTITFNHIVDHFGGEYELRLETSGDGGETWTTVATFPNEDFGPVEETFQISNEDVGSDEFHVAWTYDGDSFNINTWGVLDVQIGSPNWLAIDPGSDSLTAGETREHTLTVDATGLSEGTLQAAIVATTNDPLAPTATVPFTLNVIENLAVTPFPSQEEVNPNEEFEVDFNVESLDDLGVFSYEMKMAFNPDRMQVQEVVTEGTLSEGLTLSSNVDNEAGMLTVVAADASGGSEPSQPLFDIEGQGTLVSIDAKAQPDHGEMTLDMTKMLFNEGEPPAAPKDSTMSVVPLYGDVDLNLSVTTADASTVLEYVVDNIDLNEAQQTHADVSGNGEVSAFDASLILRRTVGMIDCFPVEPSCGEDQPALAGKSSESSSEGRLKEIFAWGEASRIESSATKSSSSEGTMLSLPLKTDKAVWPASYGNIRAIEVSTEIDPDAVSVKALESNLSDDWQAVYRVTDNGTLKISMAGTTPLNEVGKVATLTLERKDADATLEMGGNVTINEGSGHELETKSIVSIPDEFALEGTFPNPFRQAATMKMDLPKDASVTVEVYDLLGRKVKTAYNGEMAAGTGRTVQIDGSDLSSGTYFYRARVEMENTTRTKSGKMTVVQ